MSNPFAIIIPLIFQLFSGRSASFFSTIRAICFFNFTIVGLNVVDAKGIGVCLSLDQLLRINLQKPVIRRPRNLQRATDLPNADAEVLAHLLSHLHLRIVHRDLRPSALLPS